MNRWPLPLCLALLPAALGAETSPLAAPELLFEGVPETMDAKRDAFDALNRHCRDDAIITSSTSSIVDSPRGSPLSVL